MATTARAAHSISRTPRVIRVRAVWSSTNRWIREVPNMAATIWTTNRTPTVVAILRRDLGLALLDAGTVVVLRVVIGCLWMGSGAEPRSHWRRTRGRSAR